MSSVDKKLKGNWDQEVRRLYDNAPVGFCYIDRELRYCYVNEWLARMNGVSVAAHLGKTLAQVIGSDAAADTLLIRQVIETREPIMDSEAEARALDASGQSRHYYRSFYPDTLEDGTVVGVICVAQHITERKRTDVALRQAHDQLEERLNKRTAELRMAEARWKEAQRIASIGNWDWNITENELWWSDEIYSIFGIEPRSFDATYEAFLEHVHPEDRKLVDDTVQRSLYNGEAYAIDNRVMLKDGTEKVVHGEAEVSFDDAGSPVRMAGTVQDITVRKRAEETIRRRAMFQTLLVEMSSQLLKALPEESDRQILWCLDRIGDNYDIDTIYLWWFTEDGGEMYSTHRWTVVEGGQRLERHKRATFPWIIRQLHQGKIVKAEDVEQLPAEGAVEKEYCQKHGIQSLLIVPQMVEQRLAGFCVFSTLRRTREWSEETIAEIKLVAECLACAYARSLAMAEIEQLRNKLQKENIYLREEVRVAHGLDEIIGESPKLRRSLQTIEKVAPTDVTVLILGETGTGKELIARAIHNLSARRDERMVTVNCPALPANLIESELFGHEKGAFTGAQSKRKGRFELADGGTLFLDELGDLALELQGKLLRVLQTGDFERLGGTQTLHSDVRLIAATNRDLKQAVDNGEFRADLFYRVSTFPIHLPALRERKDDIPLLAEHFLRKHASRFGKDISAISSRMLKMLVEYSWPGNIRELENEIERALISSAGNSVLELSGPLKSTIRIPETEPVLSISERADMLTVERSHILNVLEKSGWKIEGKNGAASALRMRPSTLRSKMKRLGITRPTA